VLSTEFVYIHSYSVYTYVYVCILCYKDESYKKEKYESEGWTQYSLTCHVPRATDLGGRQHQGPGAVPGGLELSDILWAELEDWRVQ